MLVLLAVPSASAAAMSGAVDAAQVTVEGPATLSGKGLALRIGGGAGDLTAAPAVEIRGSTITIEYTYVHQLGTGTARFPFPQDPGEDGSLTLSGASVQFEDWVLGDGSLLVTAAGRADTTAQLSGAFAPGTFLDTVPENGRRITIDAADGSTVEPVGGEKYARTIAPYSLWVNATALDATASFVGDFEVLLYGTTYTVAGREGEFRAVTGHSFRNYAPGAAETWHNFTRLIVQDGSLRAGVAGNPADGFGQGIMRMAGEGTLGFQSPAGTLSDHDQRTYPVLQETLVLSGTYETTVRYEAGVGFRVGLAGDFAGDALALSGATVALGGGSLLPWFLVGGAVLATGGSVLLFRRRRGERPFSTVTAAQVEIVREPPVPEPAIKDPLEEPEFDTPGPPGVDWAQLAEEFGVIQAAEAAGVVVVLVSINRMQTFIQSVVQRGLIAEDTGDRVHVGETEMAVVTLEPSPVMMN